MEAAAESRALFRVEVVAHQLVAEPLLELLVFGLGHPRTRDGPRAVPTGFGASRCPATCPALRPPIVSLPTYGGACVSCCVVGRTATVVGRTQRTAVSFAGGRDTAAGSHGDLTPPERSICGRHSTRDTTAERPDPTQSPSGRGGSRPRKRPACFAWARLAQHAGQPRACVPHRRAGRGAFRWVGRATSGRPAFGPPANLDRDQILRSEMQGEGRHGTARSRPAWGQTSEAECPHAPRGFLG
jgi:hypothetical protein